MLFSDYVSTAQNRFDPFILALAVAAFASLAAWAPGAQCPGVRRSAKRAADRSAGRFRRASADAGSTAETRD